MKRLTITLLVAVSAALGSAPARAAQGPLRFHLQPAHRANLSRITLTAVRSLHRPRPFQGELPAVSRQQAGDLHIAETSFPNGVDPKLNGIADTSTADNLFFGVNSTGIHTRPYSAFNRTTGYFEAGGWTPQGFGDQLQAYYQGSIYPTVKDAAGAWADGVVNAEAHAISQHVDCSGGGVTCEKNYLALQNGQYVSYIAAGYNNCNVETAVEYNDVAYSAVGQQIEDALATITVAAVNVMTAACGGQQQATPSPTSVTPKPTPITPKPTPITPKPTPITPQPGTGPTTVSWQLLGVHVEKNGAQPNYRGTSLKKVKAGKKAQLAVYLGIQSAPAGTPVQVAVGVYRGKKLLWSKGSQGELDQDYTQTALSVRFTYTFKGTGNEIVIAKAQVGTGPVQQAQAKVALSR